MNTYLLSHILYGGVKDGIKFKLSDGDTVWIEFNKPYDGVFVVTWREWI